MNIGQKDINKSTEDAISKAKTDLKKKTFKTLRIVIYISAFMR